MKKNQNNITELVFILDRSGSMGGLEGDTIGGFNAMIEKQKKQEGEAFVTTILFDHETEVLHDRIPLEKVAPLTDKDYTVRGCTALLDAIGEAIERVKLIHKYIRAEFDSKTVKGLIEKQKKQGWEFLFIGANIDAVETASRFGISEDRAVNYCADSQGTGVVYESVCEAVSDVRGGMPLAKSWSNKINADFKKRSGR